MTVEYRFGSFELQPDQRRLLEEGRPLELGHRAFDVLLTLVERAGELVTKDELLRLVWPGLVVEENNLQVQVSSLRKIQPSVELVLFRRRRLLAAGGPILATVVSVARSYSASLTIRSSRPSWPSRSSRMVHPFPTTSAVPRSGGIAIHSLPVIPNSTSGPFR